MPHHKSQILLLTEFVNHLCDFLQIINCLPNSVTFGVTAGDIRTKGQITAFD